MHIKGTGIKTTRELVKSNFETKLYPGLRN